MTMASTSAAAMAGPFALLLIGWWLPVFSGASVIFGVRVPLDRVDEDVIDTARRRYRWFVGVAGSVAVAAGVWLAFAVGGLWIPAAAAATVLLVLLMAYLRSHAMVRAVKEREGWYQDVEQVAVADTALRRDRQAWMWLWAMPSIGVLVATAVVGIVRYPSMPDRLALHFGAGGRGDEFAAKSVGSAFALVFIEAAVTAILVGVAVGALRSAAILTPKKPAASARRYRTDTAVMVAAMLVLAAGVNVCLLLTALRIWDGASSMPGWLVFLPLLLGTAVVIAVAVFKGAGARAERAERLERPTRAEQRDDDRYWRAGLVYANRDDPAVLVQKRFGVGWTVNFGNPRTLIGLAAAVVIVVVVVMAVG